MTVENSEIIDSFRELINAIKEKSLYNRSVDLSANNSLPVEYYEGAQDAYFHVLDEIISHIKSDEKFTLEQFGLEDFNLNQIFDAIPKRTKDD